MVVNKKIYACIKTGMENFKEIEEIMNDNKLNEKEKLEKIDEIQKAFNKDFSDTDLNWKPNNK